MKRIIAFFVFFAVTAVPVCGVTYSTISGTPTSQAGPIQRGVPPNPAAVATAVPTAQPTQRPAEQTALQPAVQPAAVPAAQAAATAIPANIDLLPPQPAGATPIPAQALPASSSAAAGSGVSVTALPGQVSRTADAAASTIPAKLDLSPATITFDTSIVNSIKLTWDAKQKENIYYNVYRAVAEDYSKLNKDRLAKTEYIDADILSATAYYYRVEAMDLSGTAYMSLSKSVKSADLFMPGTPSVFKAYQDIETATLKWSAGSAGSYPVSGYNIYRGRMSDKLEFVKFLPAIKSAYNDDEVEPAIKYYYRMAAVDIKGNQSKPTDTQGVIPFPPPRTGLVIMPTAFRNNIYDNFGFNMDFGFTYYIGSIIGEHKYNLGTDPVPITGSDNFAKIGQFGVWLLTVDAKWTLFNEYERWIPSLGFGMLYSILLQDSSGNSDTRQASATFSVGKSIINLPAVNFIASKKLFWETTLHAGYAIGLRFNKESQGPAGFLPFIINSFVPSQYSDAADINRDVRNAYYIGFSRPLFRKMGLKVELLVPMQLNENHYSPFLPVNYIINTHIDRLINFDIAYLHYDKGFAWLGYISLRFSIYPNPYK